MFKPQRFWVLHALQLVRACLSCTYKQLIHNIFYNGVKTTPNIHFIFIIIQFSGFCENYKFSRLH